MRKFVLAALTALVAFSGISSAQANVLLPGSPLNPAGPGGLGVQSTLPFGVNSPMLSLGGTTAGAVGLPSVMLDTSFARAVGYNVVADLSTTGALALDQADMARQAQELIDTQLSAQRQADLAARQTQVGPDGCPTSVPAGTLRGAAAGLSVYQLCADSVAQAATPHAAAAIKWAFSKLGAPYACNGVGRMGSFQFDCSSLVTRAYSEGAGLNTAGSTWAPSTRDLAPWGGASLAPWASFVPADQAAPGDLIVFTTPSPDSEHVVMLLANNLMLHTNSCGDVAHVTNFPGFSGSFLVARRVDASKA